MTTTDRQLAVELPLLFVDIAVVGPLHSAPLPPWAFGLVLVFDAVLLLLAGRLLHIILHTLAEGGGWE